MPNFQYSAVTADGRQVKGEYIAQDENGVMAMLRQGDLYPVYVRSIKQGEVKVGGRKLPVKLLAIFCSQISVMMKVGIPVAKTMELLSEQTEHKVLRDMLEDVLDDVNRGGSLTEAFKQYSDVLPKFFLNMVEVGETSGTLDSCLERAGSFFGRISRLNTKVRNAMIYPCFVVAILIGLLVLCLVWVVPAFVSMYGDVDLPTLTQVLINVSDFVQNSWYIILGFIVSVVVLFSIWSSSTSGGIAFDRFKFKIFFVHKLLRKIYAARFAHTLSSLFSVGVSVPVALEISARTVLNRHMEQEIYKLVDNVSQGAELSGQLEQMGLLPPLMVYMVRLGEESGTMDKLLTDAAELYDDEAESAIGVLVAMMEPALLLLMGMIILPILVAVLLPMFGMYEMLLTQ